MNDLEVRLRNTLSVEAGRVRGGADPIPTLERLARRRRLQRLGGVAVLGTCLAAAAAVLAVAVSGSVGQTVAGVNGSSTSPAHPSTSATSQTTLGPTPVGTPLVQAIRQFLESDPAVLKSVFHMPNFGGHIYCGIAILGSSSDGSQQYVWDDCEEFYVQNGHVLNGSGGAIPLRLTVQKSTNNDFHVVTFRAPPESPTLSDMERLFPPAIAEKMLNGNLPTDQSQSQLQARAINDYLAGRLK